LMSGMQFGKKKKTNKKRWTLFLWVASEVYLGLFAQLWMDACLGLRDLSGHSSLVTPRILFKLEKDSTSLYAYFSTCFFVFLLCVRVCRSICLHDYAVCVCVCVCVGFLCSGSVWTDLWLFKIVFHWNSLSSFFSFKFIVIVCRLRFLQTFCPYQCVRWWLYKRKGLNLCT
jgi:hypothetical protein